MLSSEYHTCTHALTTFLLPRDGWVAKQQHGVLEKKFLGYKLVVFGAHVLSIDHSRWFYCKNVDRVVFHVSTTIAPPCIP